MKKLNLSFLTLSMILFCNLSKTHAADDSFISLMQLRNSNRYPYLAETLSIVYSHSIFRIDIYGTRDNNSKKVSIFSELLAIPDFYRTTDYNGLTAFEKKLFDYYRFDQTQMVTVIGLKTALPPYSDGAKNGSIVVNGNVQYIVWNYDSGTNTYTLFDTNDPSIQIASAVVTGPSNNTVVTYTYLL